MRSVRLTVVAIALVGMASACGSDSGSSSHDTSASSVDDSGAPSTEAAATLALTTGTAGTLPAGFTPAESAVHGDTHVVIGSISPAGDPVPAAAVQVGGGEWQVVTVDDGSGYSPEGGLSVQYGWRATSVTAGANGFVAVGYAGLFSSSYNKGTGSLVWYSPDGISWTRVDPRSAISGVSVWLNLSRVRATAGGFVLSGTNGLNQAIALTSTDGTTWTQTDAFPTQWSLAPIGLYTDGTVVVAEANEYLCLTDPFAAGTQPLLRWSADGGTTWSSVDMSAVPTLGNFVPEPDAATCATPEYSGYDNLGKLAGTHGPIGVVDGKLVVADQGLSTAASTTDGGTWTTADLPGPAPVAGYAFFNFRSRPSIVTTAGGATLIVVQVPGDYGEAPPALAAWSSSDGLSWTAVTGPKITPAGDAVLVDAAEGGVVVITYPIDGQDNLTGPATLTTLSIA
ncbi:MAG TPA: hypothetical protein PLV13_05810 [Ilumatobacteraceae bacterium]|nr:hypothetical protein [Ilumatobacteraceae bacterium]